jgi:hypothetical protein
MFGELLALFHSAQAPAKGICIGYTLSIALSHWMSFTIGRQMWVGSALFDAMLQASVVWGWCTKLADAAEAAL